MIENSAYAGLFLSAFVAASVVPAQSEAILIALLLTHDYNFWLLIVTASTGNTLGAILNWWLGRSLERFQHKRWFPLSQAQLHTTQLRFIRYGGYWTLLFAWLPVLGDALTVIAGVMQVPLSIFVVLVAIAKFARYLFLAWLVI